jgi:hypothetical protein
VSQRTTAADARGAETGVTVRAFVINERKSQALSLHKRQGLTCVKTVGTTGFEPATP